MEKSESLQRLTSALQLVQDVFTFDQDDVMVSIKNIDGVHRVLCHKRVNGKLVRLDAFSLNGTPKVMEVKVYLKRIQCKSVVSLKGKEPKSLPFNLQYFLN